MSLSEAIQIVNETGYGLTSGLESLDDREQTEWLAGIRAGNLYVNRSTTGAIVLRQPFGGMGRSAFGPGIKAGGPNYVAQLMRFQEEPRVGKRGSCGDQAAPIRNPHLRDLVAAIQRGPHAWKADFDSLQAAIQSFDQAASEEFLISHDHFRLLGQDNIRRYVPVPMLVIRLTPSDSWKDMVMRIAAAKAVGCRAIVSAAKGVHAETMEIVHDMTESWAADIEFVEQSDEELIEAVEWGGVSRLRYAAPDRVPLTIRKAVIDRYVHVADAPVHAVGRIELLWYVQEQSVSRDYHRYGNLGLRAREERAAVE